MRKCSLALLLLNALGERRMRLMVQRISKVLCPAAMVEEDWVLMPKYSISGIGEACACSFEIICMAIHRRRVERAQHSRRRNIKKRHKSVVISSHQTKIWKSRLFDVWYHVSKSKIEWINLAMGRINAVTGCKVAIQIRRGLVNNEDTRAQRQKKKRWATRSST